MIQNYLRNAAIKQSLPDWDFYFCEVDEKPAIISVDLNLASGAPHREMPYLVYISLKINKISVEGFPAPSELGMLCQIEDRVLEMLAGQNIAQFCGRVTTGGCRDLIFYSKNPNLALTTFQQGMKFFPNYKFETGWKDDSEWDLYFSFLFPNERELNTIFNQRVVSKLQEKGEKLTEKRLLEHAAFFENDNERDRFIVKLIDEYFKIEEVSRDDSKEKHVWQVRFSRQDFLDIEHINALTAELLEMAQSCTGIYDGWKPSKT